MPDSARPGYRPDIDGLRAISALAVVFFHAHVPGFGGGFVGVDVFFVISGYLITQLLWTPSDVPVRRQLAEFYLRRCRRVLPALLGMLLALTPIAVLVLNRAELATYGKYLGATSVLLTNLAAWTDHARGWPSLIHLWTIAVEEQFYLAYPLLLLAARRVRGLSAAALIGVLAALSFGSSVWASYAAPGANFYLTPPRTWELLLGALLVLTRCRVRGRIAAESLSVACLATIALAVCLFSSKTRYPGLLALPVCLAAAGLLAAGDQGRWVARLLSLRALVFLGLISYSLYLWHAAVLSLYWSWKRGAPDALQTVLLLIASAVLAGVSWRVVERPIRSGTWLKSNGRFLATMAVLNGVLCLAGLLLWKGQLHGH